MKSIKNEGKQNLHKNEIQKNYQISGTVAIQKMSIRIKNISTEIKVCEKDLFKMQIKTVIS